MSFIKNILQHPLAKNFLVYSFGAFFLKGISFLLLPLYTELLTPAEYGILDLVSTFANILDITLSLGLLQVVMIEYFHYSEKERSALFSKVLSSFTVISSVLYAAALVIAIVWKAYIFPGVKDTMLAVVVATSYFTFYQSFLILILRQQQQALRVTLLQVLSGVISIALNVLFVAAWKWGVDGILWSSFIGVMAFLGYTLYYFIRVLQLRFHFEKTSAIAFIRLGLPFVPNALALWLMSSANRWILLNYTNLDEVGYYSVAFKFSSMLDPLIIQPFLGAYTPRMMERYKAGRYAQPVGTIAALSAVGLIVAGVSLSILASFMIDEKFTPSLSLIPVLVFANFFSFMAQASALILLYHKRVVPMVLSITGGAVAGVGANLVLVPIYGGMGSAIAANVGGLVWFACIFALRKKEMALVARNGL